jgi:ketosteroid isomerase-like protein
MDILGKWRNQRLIGAILAKKMGGQAFERLNKHDLTNLMAGTAEDATFTFPGNTPHSGENKGRKAIVAIFSKMFERFPKINFTVKEVFVSNIFALGATNNVAVEWQLAYTNREGKEFLNSGVTVIRVKGGKVVEIHDYITDLDTLNEAWKGA